MGVTRNHMASAAHVRIMPLSNSIFFSFLLPAFYFLPFPFVQSRAILLIIIFGNFN